MVKRAKSSNMKNNPLFFAQDKEPLFKFNIFIDSDMLKDRKEIISDVSKNLDEEGVAVSKSDSRYFKKHLFERKMLKSNNSIKLKNHFIYFSPDKIIIQRTGIFGKVITENYANIHQVSVAEDQYNNLSDYKTIKIYFHDADNIETFSKLFRLYTQDFITIVYTYNEYHKLDFNKFINFLRKKNPNINFEFYQKLAPSKNIGGKRNISPKHRNMEKYFERERKNKKRTSNTL